MGALNAGCEVEIILMFDGSRERVCLDFFVFCCGKDRDCVTVHKTTAKLGNRSSPRTVQVVAISTTYLVVRTRTL
jgi:uncharacterized membrane protein